ncbi:MAG: thermonuclease family protein [Yoonia sp.]|nr:thermonuclease family protein [Yoonia sp.]
MRIVDPISFAYAILLIAGLVAVADWVAPYENVTAQGCVLDYVYDGDTVALACGAERITARVLGLDAPEAKSPQCSVEKVLADQATLRLRALTKEGEVTFAGHARDKYRRMLVTMKVDGKDVAQTLIREGLAVPYTGGKRIDWCARMGA